MSKAKKPRGTCRYCERQAYLGKAIGYGKNRTGSGRPVLSHVYFDRMAMRTAKCPGSGEVCYEDHQEFLKSGGEL
jgi:hypothetical protein